MFLPLLLLVILVIALASIKMPPASQGAYWDKHGNELCCACHKLIGLHEKERACPTQQELPF